MGAPCFDGYHSGLMGFDSHWETCEKLYGRCLRLTSVSCCHLGVAPEDARSSFDVLFILVPRYQESAMALETTKKSTPSDYLKSNVRPENVYIQT